MLPAARTQNKNVTKKIVFAFVCFAAGFISVFLGAKIKLAAPAAILASYYKCTCKSGSTPQARTHAAHGAFLHAAVPAAQPHAQACTHAHSCKQPGINQRAVKLFASRLTRSSHFPPTTGRIGHLPFTRSTHRSVWGGLMQSQVH